MRLPKSTGSGNQGGNKGEEETKGGAPTENERGHLVTGRSGKALSAKGKANTFSQAGKVRT